MEFNLITNSLFVGSCPQTPEDVLELKRLGISHVMSLQTDADLQDYGVDWHTLRKFYDKCGIGVTRFPSSDYTPEELRTKLLDAVETLNLIIESNIVYLHCSAGINRSPTLAIAYMIRKLGMTRGEAIRAFLLKRTAAPYTEILPE